jgi:uncharacterized protein
MQTLIAPPPRAFLTARWANLILANYAVPAEVLQPYLPPGVKLDHWQGQTYASLVGFQFLDTRVLGIRWPTFQNFPEWNLRIYVKRGEQRGVCFVREFVPQRLVAWVARAIYNEPYRAARMGMAIDETADSLRATYTLKFGGRTHTMQATGTKPTNIPGPDSVEYFFKEHSWGFGQTRRGKLIRYEVNHPEWAVFPVANYQIDIDWAALYGPEWVSMNGVTPDSVTFAAGSDVRVYPKGALDSAGQAQPLGSTR